MKRFWQKYYQLMRVSWLILLEYRGETFFYMFGSLAYPLVMMAVWISVSASGSTTSTLAGYTAGDFVRYFLAAIVIARLAASWDLWALEEQIRTGKMSSFIVRPFHPIHWMIAENIVYKIFYGVLMIGVWLVGAWFFPILRIHLSVSQWFGVILAVSLAAVIRYALGYCIGLLAFWTNRSVAIGNLVESIGLFLRGMVAPLALLPPVVRSISEWTPFYWVLGFPADLLTRPWSEVAVGQGFLIQAIWAVLLLILLRWMWKVGMKTYSAVGG